MRHFLWICVLGMTVCGSGCGTDHLRWRTEIDAEGRVTRTVYLPVKKVPTESAKPALWDRSGYTDESLEKSEVFSIDQLKLSSDPQQDDKELSYFVAQGTFEFAEEIPTLYRIQVGQSNAVSENQTNLQINDYLVLKEYLWNETITEAVSLKDVPQARRELVKMFVEWTRDTLDEFLGEVYDTSDLLTWMQTDGDRWIEEAHGVFLDAALEEIKPEDLEAEFGAVCARYGLEELTRDGVRKFIDHLLREKLRRTDGEPIEDEVITAILNFSGFSLQDEIDENSPLHQISRRVIREQYQSKERAQELLGFQLARLLGVHGIPLFLAPEEFQVSLKLPGRIVQTDATLRADGELTWTFKDEQIAPFGYQMSGRSIVTDSESQKQVLNRQTPLTNAQLDRILELFSLDDSLRQVMIDCGHARSIEPLKAYRDQFYQKNDQGEEMIDSTQDDQRARADELWEMLSSSNTPRGATSSSAAWLGGRAVKPFGILFLFLVIVSLLAVLGNRDRQSTIPKT